MSIPFLQDPNMANKPSLSISVPTIISNNFVTQQLITNILGVKNISSSSVSTPNAGDQFIFGNSDSNNNLTIKNSSASLISLSSSLSNFIVSNNANDGMKYLTIQAAIDDAALTGNNETVIIRTGVYNENITLKDKINLIGVNSYFATNNTPVSIIGTMTINFTGEASVNNLSFSNDSANCINVTGNSSTNFSNCNFKTTTAGDCIYVNDSLSSVNLRNCMFTAVPSLNYFININACSQFVVFDSTLGINTNSNILVNNGLLSIAFSGIGGTIHVNSGLCVLLNDVISTGDIPAFDIVNPSSTLICTNTTILSNSMSSTDFAIGTGTLIKSLISLLGRTTAAGTLNIISLTVF